MESLLDSLFMYVKNVLCDDRLTTPFQVAHYYRLSLETIRRANSAEAFPKVNLFRIAKLTASHLALF